MRAPQIRDFFLKMRHWSIEWLRCFSPPSAKSVFISILFYSSPKERVYACIKTWIRECTLHMNFQWQFTVRTGSAHLKRARQVLRSIEKLFLFVWLLSLALRNNFHDFSDCVISDESARLAISTFPLAQHDFRRFESCRCYAVGKCARL